MALPEKPLASIVHQREPLNAGPPREVQRASPITPVEAFYVRNHAPIPVVDVASYRLRVGGLVERGLEFDLEALRAELPVRTLVATLQCAGFRRRELMSLGGLEGQVPWDTEPIGTARWTGVALADVLMAAGIAEAAAHVELLGLDRPAVDGQQVPFGASIPLSKALSPEVVLAYEMNGEPLRPEHGAPLRAVVGGYIAARSVKWLERIELRRDPSPNPFQSRDYHFAPAAPAQTPLDGGFPLGELNVNAVICRPADGAELAAGPVRIEGYAIAGGGREVRRVELSIDGGRQWTAAQLAPPLSPWAWRFWQLETTLPAGPHEILVRAWDEAANTQPPDAAGLWNAAGYMNNAWHTVRLRALPEAHR